MQDIATPCLPAPASIIRIAIAWSFALAPVCSSKSNRGKVHRIWLQYLGEHETFKIKAIGISTYVMSSCYLWSKSYVLYSSEKLIEFLHLVVKLCQQKTRILLRHR